MIGYHYTDAKFWESIKKDGLIPYSIIKETIQTIGIWTYQERQFGRKLLGVLMWHMSMKGTDEVIELRVRFNGNQRWKPSREFMKNGGWTSHELYHRGSSFNWVFHEHEYSAICLKPIPPSKIELLHKYNLVEILESYCKTIR